MAKQKSVRGEKGTKGDTLLIMHIIARIVYLSAKGIRVPYPPKINGGVAAFRKWAKLFLKTLDDWHGGGSGM